MKGPNTPRKSIDNGQVAVKPMNEWDEHDKRLASINGRAMSTLYCGKC